jgi:diguanylate cyclase (GGDEF)-like protein
LDPSRFLTALLNPHSLMSIGAFNCLVIMGLSLMQSRRNQPFSTAMRLFAICMFLAGFAMFAFVTTDPASSARTLFSYGTSGLAHTFGLVSALYFFDQVKFRVKAVAASLLTLSGFFFFSDAPISQAWNSFVSAFHLAAIGAIAYRSNEAHTVRAKYAMVVLVLFTSVSTMPWLYKYLQFGLSGEPALLNWDSFSLMVSALIWATAPILFYAVLVAMINLRAEQVLKTEANVDSLTGIANRRRLLAVANAGAQDERHDFGKGSALFLIDIDHFKRVNDSFGHGYGDNVLIHCAKVLEHAVRPQDTIGRYGGEEFCVVAKDIDFASAQQMAERLCDSLRNRPYVAGADTVNITASVGVKHYMNTMPVHRVFEYADNAMYKAKNAGRDQAYMSEA